MRDADLADLMLRSPEAGLAAVYQHYGDRIHDYCRSILRNDADAADALQDTFLAASTRIGQLRDPERLRPWLYAIARNRSYRTIRERQRQRPVDDLETVMSAADRAEPADAGRLESEEARDLVWEAAGGLDDRDRDVLDLHLRHGLAGAELATVLGVTAPQANQAMHRMRERLNRSVGAALAMRHGRSDCAELRAIVGAYAGAGPGASGEQALTPLLRKRVARHLERCDTCEHHRHAGATIFAGIPLVGAPDFVGPALAAIGPGGAAGQEAAASIGWDQTGFPRPGSTGGATGTGAGTDVGTPSPGDPFARPAPPTSGPGRLARLGAAGRLGPRFVTVAAVAALVALGGVAIGRAVGGGPGDQVASGEVSSDIQVPDADAPASDSEGADGDGSDTGSSDDGPAEDPPAEDPPAEDPTATATSTSTSTPTASTATTSTATTSTATSAPTAPSTSTSTTPSTESLPTVTFIADGQAPTMKLAVDCSSGVRITATLNDNTDPAPTGDLEVTWPPSRSRALPPAPAAPTYEVVLSGGDLAGLNGQVNFNVSGRISDAAGNLADVFDSVSCIFFED